MRSWRPRSSRVGFTTLELAIVLAILVVLSCIAIPTYQRNIRRSRLTEATKRMGLIVNAAKTYAIANANETGDPVWPPNQAGGVNGLIDLRPSQCFTYKIMLGGGERAETASLSVRAEGIPGTQMSGVTVTFWVANIHAAAGSPIVAGL